MTNLDIAYKTKTATKETTINLTTLIDTLQSVRQTLKVLFDNKVSFAFRHTSISSFKVSITVNDDFESENLFEHSKEKTYQTYLDSLNSILSGGLVDTDIKYISNIQKLLKSISDDKEDVELTFQNDEENFKKVLYIKNQDAKNGFLNIKKALQKDTVTVVQRTATIFLLQGSKHKSHIGFSFDGGSTVDMVCSINEQIRSDILSGIYKMGDKVEFSAEVHGNKKTAKLLYIKNKSTKSTLF